MIDESINASSAGEVLYNPRKRFVMNIQQILVDIHALELRFVQPNIPWLIEEAGKL